MSDYVCKTCGKPIECDSGGWWHVSPFDQQRDHFAAPNLLVRVAELEAKLSLARAVMKALPRCEEPGCGKHAEWVVAMLDTASRIVSYRPAFYCNEHACSGTRVWVPMPYRKALLAWKEAER